MTRSTPSNRTKYEYFHKLKNQLQKISTRKEETKTTTTSTTSKSTSSSNPPQHKSKVKVAEDSIDTDKNNNKNKNKNKMEDFVFEFHHNRELAIKLKQAGHIDKCEIIHASSTTLSTIHESNYNSQCHNEEIEVQHRWKQNDRNELIIDTYPEDHIILKNKLHDSLPSMEWSNAVNGLVTKKITTPKMSNVTSGSMSRPRPMSRSRSKELLEKTFDRRNGQETSEEAFEQLHILKEISNELKEEEREGFPFYERSHEDERRNDCSEEKRDDSNEQRVLSARESQLRRRIFKLQRESDCESNFSL